MSHQPARTDPYQLVTNSILTESDGFGGKAYSQKELVAEMGAAFLGMEAEIVRDQHEQSAAYLQWWQAGQMRLFTCEEMVRKTEGCPWTKTSALKRKCVGSPASYGPVLTSLVRS